MNYSELLTRLIGRPSLIQSSLPDGPLTIRCGPSPTIIFYLSEFDAFCLICINFIYIYTPMANSNLACKVCEQMCDIVTNIHIHIQNLYEYLFIQDCLEMFLHGLSDSEHSDEKYEKVQEMEDIRNNLKHIYEVIFIKKPSIMKNSMLLFPLYNFTSKF